MSFFCRFVESSFRGLGCRRNEAQGQVMEAQDPVGALQGRNEARHEGGTTEARVPRFCEQGP